MTDRARALAPSQPTRRERGRDPVLSRLSVEWTYQLGVMAWTATHPGPGQPFPDTELAPDLPPNVAALEGEELFMFAMAWTAIPSDVGGAECAAPDDANARTSWDARYLRDADLGAVLATDSLTGAA